ncbi:Type I secretion system ATP-binding protein PrsD [Roseovarius gaetbuli]|uniref:Type I secretion system ATP-binding protein PrsD n=1 Tax=Roseovarius gaetbuli TaxID=1356575 RepID=A0A1X6ZIM8_9RHOB|nr:type I secretion system permease/ATPase [Roseovarius gaetbuli]SLN52241.1 Type I secretion system ATP-binding protein PrsD [Roseovarius gaetbuli]
MRLDKRKLEAGHEELRAARRESRGLYWFVGVFSFFANLLMLTGPIYMLQVYDRVLGSGSVETLIALSVLVVFLYGMMALLDYARGRIMGRVGARFQARLDRRVFDAVIRKSAVAPDATSATGLSNLESVQRLMTSPVLLSIFDMPWTPFFFAAIWVFHPWLGTLALLGGLVLVFVTVINQFVIRNPLNRANNASVQAEATSQKLRAEAEMVQAMGMRDAAFDRWQMARKTALVEQIRSADIGGSFTTTTKAFRLFLQSAMLGLGAYLVLQGEMTPGGMIAGSILLGRALAPIEQAIGQWALIQRAAKGWTTLAELLASVPPEEPRTPLPDPRAILEMQQVTVVAPGESQAALKSITFKLQPGQALGVIGTSGAGKSTLARAITGVWRPAGGKIRLDGASLEQYDPAVLGRHIGYLPQRVQLFEGTIAENIARLSPEPDAAKVVEAAQKADAHAMILKLPDGYDTKVSANGGRLSGGQMQRIGLARAMYGDPKILVLDEPNSNLDNEGSEAVNTAIRGFKAEGKAVVIVAHRPTVIKECDLLLMLDNGMMRSFGPRDKVLQEVLQNPKETAKTPAMGGIQ